MRRFRPILVVILVVVVAAAGWLLVGRGRTAASGGVVVLEWTGTSRGRAVLPATVAWCPINRVATLEAISTDTGLIITVLENDSLSRGPHQVVSPEIRDASPRPSAVAAIRWVNDSGALVGFRSVSGVVDVQPDGNIASGSFQMLMRKPVGLDTVVVRGDFRGLAVTAGAVGCP